MGSCWPGPRQLTSAVGISAVDLSFLPSLLPCKVTQLDWIDSKSLPALIAHMANKGAIEVFKQEPSLKPQREVCVTTHAVSTQVFLYRKS